MIFVANLWVNEWFADYSATVASHTIKNRGSLLKKLVEWLPTNPLTIA
jgi:hypothetical protein